MTITFFDRNDFGTNFKDGDRPETARDAIEEAALDWGVKKRNLFLDDGAEVPSNYAMVREDNEDVLGIVGERYTPLQNIEAFEFFDSLVSDGLAEYHLAGQSLGGRKVWVLAKFKDDVEVLPDDLIQKYILLSSSHDGSGSVLACVTPLRVVCDNMLSSVLRLSKQARRRGINNHINIRHTKTITDRVAQASKTLDAVNEVYNELAPIWQEMAQIKLPPVAIQNYFKEVIPDNPDSENPYKTVAMRTEMHQYLKTGRGHQLKLQDTLWGAYNAVTEYMTHEVSDRKGSSFDKHMDSVWFGQRGARNDKAMQAALKIMAA